jgi:hypothetical protein
MGCPELPDGQGKRREGDDDCAMAVITCRVFASRTTFGIIVWAWFVVMMANENKMSDGGRDRASLGVEV